MYYMHFINTYFLRCNTHIMQYNVRLLQGAFTWALQNFEEVSTQKGREWESSQVVQLLKPVQTGKKT